MKKGKKKKNSTFLGPWEKQKSALSSLGPRLGRPHRHPRMAVKSEILYVNA